MVLGENRAAAAPDVAAGKGRIMDENIAKRNEMLAQKVIKGLKSRNMTGYYAATKEEACALADKVMQLKTATDVHEALQEAAR